MIFRKDTDMMNRMIPLVLAAIMTFFSLGAFAAETNTLTDEGITPDTEVSEPVDIGGGDSEPEVPVDPEEPEVPEVPESSIPEEPVETPEDSTVEEPQDEEPEYTEPEYNEPEYTEPEYTEDDYTEDDYIEEDYAEPEEEIQEETQQPESKATIQKPQKPLITDSKPADKKENTQDDVPEEWVVFGQLSIKSNEVGERLNFIGMCCVAVGVLGLAAVIILSVVKRHKPIDGETEAYKAVADAQQKEKESPYDYQDDYSYDNNVKTSAPAAAPRKAPAAKAPVKTSAPGRTASSGNAAAKRSAPARTAQPKAPLTRRETKFDTDEILNEFLHKK